MLFLKIILLAIISPLGAMYYPRPLSLPLDKAVEHFIQKNTGLTVAQAAQTGGYTRLLSEVFEQQLNTSTEKCPYKLSIQLTRILQEISPHWQLQMALLHYFVERLAQRKKTTSCLHKARLQIAYISEIISEGSPSFADIPVLKTLNSLYHLLFPPTCPLRMQHQCNNHLLTQLQFQKRFQINVPTRDATTDSTLVPYNKDIYL
jgi:hypothetical protein